MWLKSLPKQDYMLTLSTSIFTFTWKWTSLPGENHHWKPPDLADHRDLDFINEATELTKHHHTLVLGACMPCRTYHLSSFSLLNQCVFPQLCRTLKPILSSKWSLNTLDETSTKGDETLKAHILHFSSLIVIREGGFGGNNMAQFWTINLEELKRNGLEQSKSNNFATKKNIKNKQFNQLH